MRSFLRVTGLAFLIAAACGSLHACKRQDTAARIAAVQKAAADAEDTAPLFTPETPTGELAAALDDPSEAVRLAALRSLGFKDDLASAVPAIVAGLEDASAAVRRASRDVLSFYANRNPQALDLELVDRLLNGEHGASVDHDEAGFRLVASLGKRGPESADVLTRAVAQGGRLGTRAAAALAAVQR